MASWTTAIKTWSTGETVTAANMNAQIKDFATAFGAWGAYTPSIGGTGWAIGNGTATGYYAQAQKTVVFSITITWGSSSTFGAGADLTLSLPVSSKSVPFPATINLVDTGTVGYVGTVYGVSGSTLTPGVCNAAGTYATLAGIRSTVPHTWASTDVIYASGIYEAA